MKIAKVFATAAAAATCAIAFLLAGCETEPASDTLKISPEYVRLSLGESVTFTASGGFEYTWSLDDGNTTSGFLSNLTGPTTTYTSNTSNALVRTLTVNSDIAASSIGTDSNSNPFAQSTSAVIEHVADTGSGAATLSVTPSEAVLSNLGDTQVFTVSGGSSLSWDLSNESIGSLSTRSGSSSTYTVLTDGTATNILVQTITITDSSGSTIEALVKHN